MRARARERSCVRTRANSFVWSPICVSVADRGWGCMRACACARVDALACVCKCTQGHLCTFMCVGMRTRKHMHVRQRNAPSRVWVRVHAYVDICAYVCVCFRMCGRQGRRRPGWNSGQIGTCACARVRARDVHVHSRGRSARCSACACVHACAYARASVHRCLCACVHGHGWCM